MKFLSIPVAASLLTMSGAAVAQSAGDAKCIIVSNAFASGSTDANAKKTAEATFYFYLGRIKDGTSAAQMKTLLEEQGKTLTDANAAAAMNSCAQAIQGKVQMLQSLAPAQAKPAATQKPQQPQGR